MPARHACAACLQEAPAGRCGQGGAGGAPVGAAAVRHQLAEMLAVWMTLAHFWDSVSMNLAKSWGVPPPT